MPSTYIIDELTWEYAREAVTAELDSLLDDPSCLNEEPERAEVLKAVALDLDLDLDPIEIIKSNGTKYEINRLLPYFESIVPKEPE